MSSRQGGSRASDEDGKTAVKVAVRVRPPLKPTDPGYELIPQRFQRSMVHVTAPTSLAVDVPQGRKLFVFDRVFPETVDQDGVWDYLNDSVNSFVQGYNVSLLAYGQSGAGKSYTMGTSGPNEQNKADAMGIIPRAAQALFEKLDGPSKHTRNGSSSTGLRTPQRYSMSSASSFGKLNIEKNWQLKATYVEIYNEHLRDLLLPESTPANDRSNVSIREDAKGRIILTGLHQVNINSFDDLIGALNFGSTIRQTDSTAINAKSSRSHAVFSLNLVQRKSNGNQPTASPKEKRMSMPVDSFSGSDSITIESKLHFVDLAGSERLKNTGASGERAKEGISINAGLAALGKVISQLSSRQSGSHVSYRDSKLTRLLQDSLGGNAYTYMIACVTPAEFHLSETLNTVQYAQRARAIQSKPRIQQIAEDGDKNALIERLKAEVAFLRQQIRNSEGSERRDTTSTERSERKNEREIQLQNQLLDAQESYNALSQRHTKLISHLANDSETANGEVDDATSDVGKSSIERMQRSRSFAESVEQVVLEYEKTIQALESSLSDTRSSLATTESTLLERETKCTYVETVNAQLQSRIQKFLDREASTETYLHELESKLDGASTGEEKHAAIVAELRKEISRARENETSCEEYISTLEDRLAESDQDMELMQREVIRLEHVIQRQRGLGQLDHLLQDLDSRHHHAETQPEGPNGVNSSYTPAASKSAFHRHTPSLDVLNEAAETAIPESDEDLAEPIIEVDEESVAEAKQSVGETSDDLEVLENVTNRLEARRSEALREEPVTSPAQSQFVADKLETVTQELFDLRLTHESALNDYELLESKYEEAMKALTALRQDKLDEVRHPAPTAQNEASRPVSFLDDGQAPISKSGAQHSFSQSLSSELSSAEGSAALHESSEDSKIDMPETPVTPVAPSTTAASDADDLEKMRKALAEHQEGADLMTQKYAELQTEHEEILSLVEKLKAEAEAQRAKTSSPTTPGFKMIRRMTSQNLLSGVDRAHRSLTSLRTIANEELSGKPETLQNFEVHLDATMHELATRMERLQSLEAENQSVKKEMDMKSTIISGLTRERSSLQGGGSSVDMGLVGQLRDQIVAQENQINELKQAHEAREKQLLFEMETLNGLLKSQEVATKAMDAGAEEQDKKIVALEGELTEWKDKHQNALTSLQSSENKLSTTLVELEAALASVETMRAERVAANGSDNKEVVAQTLESERSKQQELVESLKNEIELHKSTISTQLATIADLERSHAEAQNQLSVAKEGDNGTADNQQDRIVELEQQITTHKSLIDTHKSDLASLQESHEKELAELEKRTRAAVLAEHDSRISEKDAEHDTAMAALQKDIAESRDELVKLLGSVSSLLNSEITAENMTDQIQDVLAQKQHFSEKYAELMDTNEDLRKQIDSVNVEELTKKSSAQDAKVNELALLVATLEDTLRQKDEQVKKKEALVDEITAEKEKSVRLVEELEEQITSSFDQHHNRLSVIQQERDQALEDAKARIVVLEKEIETYQVRIEQLELQIKNSGSQDGTHDRSSSLTSNLRKSSSAASLPSPPPAIPLPPLPSIASQSNGTTSVSPPGSRHASRELVNAQIVEDQETRIRTIEKHLYAEKQLTATLEEALGDLEAQSSKVKTDCEGWKKKAWGLEDELATLRKERNSARLSLQAVEEERSARREAEAARAQLEERMNALNKKKKKSTLNCF